MKHESVLFFGLNAKYQPLSTTSINGSVHKFPAESGNIQSNCAGWSYHWDVRAK